MKAGSFLIGGAVLSLMILGACWLKFGQLDGWALGAAAGGGLVVELVGIARLLRERRAKRNARPELVLLRKLRPAGRAGLELQFCKTALLRLGPGKDPLLDTLRERGHDPVIRECLNRCVDCRTGLLMVSVHGVPLSPKDGDQLLSDLDEL